MEDEMTDETAAIEMTRGIYRKAAAQCIVRGIQPVDAVIGMIYATHDVAQTIGHSPAGAIEYLRNALDVMERQVLAQGGATN
jgi:hypothetical protein